MNLSRTFFRTVVAIGAALFLQPATHAGTSDLFRATASFHCTLTNSVLNLNNKRLINLALGQPLNGKVPAHLALGLQCNCATLEMDLVVYNTRTTNTVATVASFQNQAFQIEGQKAWTLASGMINNTGSLASGALAAHLVIGLSSNACAAQTSISAVGQFTIVTPYVALPLILKNGAIRTHGPQLRSAAMTGSDVATDPPIGFVGASASNSNVFIVAGGGNTALVVTNGGLVIGGGNNNSLIISNGSVFTNVGTIFIGSTNAYGGSLLVTNGNRGLIIGNGGGGSLIIGNGGLVGGGNLTLSSNSVLTLALTGFANGMGTNNVIHLGGNLQYGGTLVVTNTTGFAFAPGQSFQLFDFGSQSGEFSVTNLPNLDPYGLAWDTSGLDTSGLLIVVPNSLTITNLDQVLNLDYAEILNVCTNELTADALATLFNTAPTNSTIILTNCATPATAP